MSSFASQSPRGKLLAFLAMFLALVLVVIGVAYYFLRHRLESDPPQVSITPQVDVVGLAPLEIRITDPGTGLRTLRATLTAGGTEHILAAEQYAQPVGEKVITLAVGKIPGIREGPAVLRIAARDASLARLGAGNEVVVEKALTIDITPPTLELVADDRYVSFGGVGAIVYKTSADVATTGVKVGNRFFPAFRGQVKDHPDHLFALFAHPYDAAADSKAVLVATDKAGNARELRLVYELKNVKYRRSTIALSEGFLRDKVTPLVRDVAARQGSVKEQFVAVNKGLRKENEEKIAEITAKATPSMLWQGAFRQLSNSKVEANFADQRTYTHAGEAVDTAYHLGYDLSVTKHYPVEAANGGNVAFVGDLGIYGNTVIIDHGLGLYTLYSHLSAFDVKVGDAVKQLQVIGKTGETGLAAGDHLHYGVYLDGLAVLPVEWWDPKWIRDNIQPKLEGKGAEAIAEARPSPMKKPSAKRRR
jgi:murein DD-endopeptidase MepM/ murein hydrolase activator NlpD